MLIRLVLLGLLTVSCTNDGVTLPGGDAGNDSATPDSATETGTPDSATDTGTPDAADDTGTPDAADDTGTPDAAEDTGTMDAMMDSMMDAAADTGTPAATFTEVQAIFESKCGGCHTTNESGGLKLVDKAMAYAELFDVDQEVSGAAGCGTKRVVPGDSANSVLVQRLRGTCSNPMPKQPRGVTEQDIQKVESWIDDGAKDN